MTRWTSPVRVFVFPPPWRGRGSLTFLVALAVLITACAGGNGTQGRAPSQAQPQTAGRTLVIASHVEPTALSPRPPTTSGITPVGPTMLFSAWLVVADGHNVPRAQLAEQLPQLDTPDWQVFPDGQMETTFRLRPGVAWHDGAPITADDVVFGWEAFTWPEMGVPLDPPIRLIGQISAPDERTVVIRWKQPYGQAAELATNRYGGLPIMPRHILDAKYRAGDVQAFLNDPYWTTGFVGSGPYRLERWEPGAFILASAFDRFVEGKPQIEQIKLVFMGDPSAVVASLLAGDVHVAGDEAIGYEQGAVLKKEWERRGDGVVLLTPNKSRYVQVQFKPDYVSPKAVLDLRVRKAILSATDRAELSAAILDGGVAVADTIAGPVEAYFSDLEGMVTKYPFSSQTAERLMGEAGFTRHGDAFVDATGQRLSLELRAFAAEPSPREAAILSSQWGTFGLDATISIIPAAQSQNLEMVSAYPAFRLEQTGLTDTVPINKLAGQSVATPENRWAGVNRGGWANAEYDRLVEVFLSSLDRAERNRSAADAFKIASDELPVLPLYYLSIAAAHTSALTGMTGGSSSDTAWDNIHTWRWVK